VNDTKHEARGVSGFWLPTVVKEGNDKCSVNSLIWLHSHCSRAPSGRLQRQRRTRWATARLHDSAAERNCRSNL